MNDASNVIITNHQSDITRIKFGKVKNKISNIVKVSDLVQKNNKSKSKSKTAYNHQNIQKNININAQKKLDSFRSKKSNASNNKNQNKKNNNKLVQKNLNTSISFAEKNYFFLKLNRLCPIKVKFFILIIFLFYNIFFLGINIYDYILYMKNVNYYINRGWLTNNYIIFILQIIGVFIMILFLFIIFFLNQGENHNFIILSIIFIIIFSSFRIIIFVKNIQKSISIIFNLVYSMCIFIINIILLMIIIIINKKKKNVLQNIDEIVYFTENNMPTQKKEKDIHYFNNSPNNNILKKVIKTVKLVEDDNNIKNKNEIKCIYIILIFIVILSLYN